jgi:subtilisin family serine protease
MGPTLDGREKPEISAPGQFVTAALARDSELQDEDDRSLDSQRLATIEGTSMAAPVITGVIALMLQKKGTLTPIKVKQVFSTSARRDQHTTAANWTPAFGFGKIDVAGALGEV